MYTDSVIIIEHGDSYGGIQHIYIYIGGNMDTYLVTHYKGKYRVKAHYDKSTNDFIRDPEGNLDDSFGDFYLSGRAGIEIKHATGSDLACYVPKLQLGNNVLKFYYDTMIKSHGNKSVDKIVKELQDGKFMGDCDILSTEVFFIFPAKYLDDLAPMLKLKTSGASISPFSTRNLPKAPYTIPKKDMDKYKKAKSELTGLQVSRIQDEFIRECCDDDVKQQMKLEMLKANQWFHKHGMWDEYCEYIRRYND